AAALSPDGALLAVQAFDRSVRLWETATGKALPPPVSPRTPAAPAPEELAGRRAAFDGPELLVASARTLICVANEKVEEIDVPGRGAMSLPLTQSIRVWDVAGARTVCKLPRPEVLGNAAALAPDGRTLAALEGHLLTVYETASGKARLQLRNLPQQETNMGPVGVAWSPDRRWLAAANRSRVVCVWDGEGREVARFAGHQGPAHTVAFTPDGRGLITGSADTTALTWDLSGAGDKGGAKPRAVTGPEAERLWED